MKAYMYEPTDLNSYKYKPQGAYPRGGKYVDPVLPALRTILFYGEACEVSQLYSEWMHRTVKVHPNLEIVSTAASSTMTGLNLVVTYKV